MTNPDTTELPTAEAVCSVCDYSGPHPYVETIEEGTDDPPQVNGRSYTCANPDGCFQVLLTERGFPVYGYRDGDTSQPIIDPNDPDAADEPLRTDVRTTFWYPLQ